MARFDMSNVGTGDSADSVSGVLSEIYRGLQDLRVAAPPLAGDPAKLAKLASEVRKLVNQYAPNAAMNFADRKHQQSQDAAFRTRLENDYKRDRERATERNRPRPA